MTQARVNNLLDPSVSVLVQQRPPATGWNIPGVVGLGMMLSSIALVAFAITLVALVWP